LKRRKPFADWERLNALPGASTTFSANASGASSAASMPSGKLHHKNMPAWGCSQGTMPMSLSRVLASIMARDRRGLSVCFR